ncbi:MAG: mandelate racemase [Verrucomicrobia bacterium]|nr:mandelate racemase [Verrucomicrobiota bacterium]
MRFAKSLEEGALKNVSTLKVRRVRARPVVVPMKLPLQTATGAIGFAPLVLVDVETTAGITGRSYLFAIGRHNLAPIVDLVLAMGEMLAGDAVAPFEIEKKLRAKYTLLGVHNIVLFAMSGIDMAAWDALGQAVGQPVTRLLGGVPRPVRAYNSKGLGIMPLPKLVREARQLVDEGFDAVKLRLGRPDAAGDLAAVRAVKKAIGPGVTLMCDFNQGLTVAEAIRRGHMIDDEGGMHWIEEPIRADDFEGCAKVADEVATPIQVGENFMGPEQMAQALAAQCCDYVMPDLQRIGGVTGWMRATALAQAAGIEMSSHLFHEVSAQLLPVTPTCHWLEYVDWADPILEEPVAVKRGFVQPLERPGLGMRWDEKAVRKYLV